VSQLTKYVFDPSHVLEAKDVQIREDLTMEHQCRKGFLSQLFWLFGLDLRPKTYLAEVKKVHLSSSVLTQGISHHYCLSSNTNRGIKYVKN